MNVLCRLFGHKKWIFRREKREADRLIYFDCPRCGQRLVEKERKP